MGKITGIGWTHSSINGSSGCNGCELWNARKHTCYAGKVHEQRLAPSYPTLYAADFHEVRTIPGRFAQAASWGPPTEKENENKPWFRGMPRHIFVGDMGDILSREITDEYLEQELIPAIRSAQGSRHIWQILTKRSRRLADLSEKWGELPPNVVAMTTVTDQSTAELRLDALIRVRCRVRGISAEPLLGCVDLRKWLRTGLIHWVIVGGESGEDCTPMDPAWALELRDQCAEFGVAFFFKQWGGVKKEQHGRILDGRTYDGIPVAALS